MIYGQHLWEKSLEEWPKVTIKLAQKVNGAFLSCLTTKLRMVPYARIVINFCPQKVNPNRVRMTAGDNLIKCPGDLTTKTADLTTSKMLWNSVLSTEGARFMGLDVGNFYSKTPMERYEYTKMPISLFPKHMIKQYNFNENAKNGLVYLEIRRAIYGLP